LYLTQYVFLIFGHYFELSKSVLSLSVVSLLIITSLGVCRREKKLPELLVWIVKSRLKQGINSLEIARLGNLAKLKDTFSSLSDSLLVGSFAQPIFDVNF